MRQTVLFLFVPLITVGQDISIRLGDLVNLIPPATNVDGRTIAFAAAVSPDGTPQKGTNLYLFQQGLIGSSIRPLTNYAGDTNLTGVTSVTYSNASGQIGFTALPGTPGGREEIHIVDSVSFTDRTLVTDKQGCIQPLCPNCFRACVGPVHFNRDATKVVYAVARSQPFNVVNTDGTGLTQLPVYQGALAPSPQRVIGGASLVVFTSSAPFGPTFAAAPTDVFTIHLDGTSIVPVTRFGTNPNFFAANATISDDGSWIAFESNFSDQGPRQSTQIWVVRPDGSNLRQISTGPDAASNPSISADGSLVVFLQGGQIKQASTASGSAILALTKLTTSAPHDPLVSGDGSQVAFTLGPTFGSAAAIFRIPTSTTSDLRNFFTVYAPRFLSTNGVATAGGHGIPSPGSLISVYGFNLGIDELAQAGTIPLPRTLDPLSLLVNGQPVPLLATTPWQINAQLPQTVPAGETRFQVRYASGTTLPAITATVAATSPESFVFAFSRGNLGYQQAAVFHAGSASAADLDHPAAAGETVEIFGLGLGVTDPVVDAGVLSPSSPPARARQTPRLQIGGRDAPVVFAGLAPGLAGIYQVNAIVPTGLTPGIQNVTWAGDGVIYSAIAVK